MSQKYKILVIGDSGIDIFRYIDTYKLSAESPTGVGKEVRKIINPGMAGNVVECLKALSPNSEILFLHQNKEIVKERIIDQKYNHIFIRVDSEDGIDRIDIEKEFYSLFVSKLVTSVDAIIISDYNKGFLKQEDIKEILDFGLVFNIPTFVDTKQPAGEFAKNAFVVKINDKEYNLSPKWENFCQNLIVTLGQKGAKLINSQGEKLINGYKVDVSSVVGAGDEFLAALTLKYLETKNLEKSIDFANYIAAISVSKPGVYCVNTIEAMSYHSLTQTFP